MTLLKNRFPIAVRSFWEGNGWYTCIKCDQNNADQLHHIISPTANCYIKGEHNRSIFNSCPICWKCHANPMQSDYNHWRLTAKVKEIVLRAIANEELELKPIDISFIKKYPQFFEELISIKN